MSSSVLVLRAAARRCIALSVMALFALPVTAQDTARRPIAVNDVVEMTRLIDPLALLSGQSPLIVKLSPDYRHFVIATQKGDLSTGENIYRITLYRTDESLAYINGGDTRPTGRDILVTRSAANLEAVGGIHWTDGGRNLAFVAAVDGKPHQAFLYDTETQTMRAMTQHPRRVQAFQTSSDQSRVAFSATVPNRIEEWDKPSFPLVDRSIHQIVQQGRENIVSLYRVYVGKPDGAKAELPVGIGEGNIPPLYSLSPDGRQLAALTDMPTDPAWAKHLPQDLGGQMGAPHACQGDGPEGGSVICWPHFVLFDLEKGTRKKLIAAPAGMRRQGAWSIAWLDNNNVLIGNVMAAKGDGMIPTVQAVDTRTGKATIVTTLTGASNTGAQITEIAPDGKDGATLIFQELAKGSTTERHFSKAGGKWREEGPAKMKEAAPIKLWVEQGYNRAPDIGGEDIRTGRRRTLTDLNPQFAGLSLGHAGQVEWRDASGRDWQANLTLPVGYEPGRHYPLIIQTHGYYGDVFIVDGPSPGPHAAQPLAGHGFVVVQMGGKGEGFATHQELLVNQAGIESLIDTLDQRGIIDRDHIGLIGWSGLGMTVDHMLVFSKYRIVAATTADGDSTGMFGYGAQANRGGGNDSLHYYEGMNDSYPWGAGLDKWIENAPVFHLDKIRTAVLVEQLGGNYVNPYWDSYAILRRLNKPVEWMIYPDGTHVLVKPLERQASMQTNVDWYRFWLKGEEDPNPAKAAQYVRWRAMRDAKPVTE